MSRLHAFLASLQELRQLQAGEAGAAAPERRAAGADGAVAAGLPSSLEANCEATRGVPTGAATAWSAPAMPPVGCCADPLLTVGNMRQRQQEQASDALLRDARLRKIHDRLHAERLGLHDAGHTARQKGFLLGNDYMAQARSSAVGFGKRWRPQPPAAPSPAAAAGGPPLASPGSQSNEAATATLRAPDVIARCADEFGRCEDRSVDVSHVTQVWESFTDWAAGIYDSAGRGFELPYLGRVVVLHQQFGASGTARERQPVFVGSQRSLAKYGLTQRLGAASFSSSANNRAARVNYKMLAKLSGLDEGDVVRRLRELVWCLLQMAAESPEAELELDLGPCTLCCHQRRLSMRFHRPPGGSDDPPAGQAGDDVETDRPPSAGSGVSDVSSWTVSSMASSTAARGRWTRWPLAPASAPQRAGSSSDAGSSDSWSGGNATQPGEEQGEGASRQPPAPGEEHGTAEATQLHAANEALGQENALLRLKLDRLLHFATEELQAVTASPPTPTPPPRPPTAAQQRGGRGFRGGSRCASALRLVDRGDYALTGSGYCVW